MRRVLQQRNSEWNIVEAADGEEALEAYFSNQPSLVFLDVHLPKINGWGILSYIRRIDKATQVVLVTSSKEPEDVLKGIELGADAFIGKPFDTEELSDVLSRVTRKPLPS